MTWTADVRRGAALDLAAAGVGVWREAGGYVDGETGITVKAAPPKPDRIIAITTYPVRSSLLSDVTLGLQVRCRGTRHPDDVDDLADAVYARWHRAQGLTFGPARIALLWRQSHAVLGPDANGRYETTSNFYAQTAHPSEHVTD